MNGALFDDIPLLGVVARLDRAVSQSDVAAIPGLCRQIEGLAKADKSASADPSRAGVEAAIAAVHRALALVTSAKAKPDAPTARARRAYLPNQDPRA